MTTTAQPVTCDLLLSGGRVIDPATGTDAIADVAIGNGRIVAVGPSLAAAPGTTTVDVTGKIVTPGFIDTHAHVYEHVTGDFGLNPDLVGVRSGVTTVVDLGGASPLTFGGFREFVVQPARTRVLSFISTYLAGGLFGHKYVDLYGPSGINVEAIVKTGRANPDLVRGVKAHAEPGGYSRWGLETLKLAKRASSELDVPLYVHLGTLWPEVDGQVIDASTIIEQVVPMLDAGDVLAHPYTRFPSGFVGKSGSVHPLIFKAIEKGVRIDVGRGGHFSFDNAYKVTQAGVLPTTLGSDLHGYNVRFPDGGRWYRGVFTDTSEMEPPDEHAPKPFAAPYGLYHLIAELMAVGIGLNDLIAMVTSNAAALLKMQNEIGALRPGMCADVSVFRELEGEWTLRDSLKVEVPTTRLIHPDMVIRAGEIMPIDSPVMPALNQLAAA